jgi:hypothetical protein
MCDDGDITILWVFLSSILACQSVLVMIEIINLTRSFIAVFTANCAKEGGAMKKRRGCWGYRHLPPVCAFNHLRPASLMPHTPRGVSSRIMPSSRRVLRAHCVG